MPRGKRYLLPGYTYHLTHRCHNRSFLFRFARDGTECCRRLRAAVKEFRISLLTYRITGKESFVENCEKAVAESIGRGPLRRGPMWTEGIAVRSESFIEEIEERTEDRLEPDVALAAAGRLDHPLD